MKSAPDDGAEHKGSGKVNRQSDSRLELLDREITLPATQMSAVGLNPSFGLQRHNVAERGKE